MAVRMAPTSARLRVPAGRLPAMPAANRTSSAYMFPRPARKRWSRSRVLVATRRPAAFDAISWGEGRAVQCVGPEPGDGRRGQLLRSEHGGEAEGARVHHPDLVTGIRPYHHPRVGMPGRLAGGDRHPAGHAQVEDPGETLPHLDEQELPPAAQLAHHLAPQPGHEGRRIRLAPQHPRMEDLHAHDGTPGQDRYEGTTGGLDLREFRHRLVAGGRWPVASGQAPVASERLEGNQVRLCPQT